MRRGNIDYIGAVVFALAIAPFLIGLTNKTGAEWTAPQVGGLMLAGLAFGALFLFIESRVPEPIVPLNLFRIRTFTISVSAMFLARSVLHGDHLPAPLVPDGRGRQRPDLGPEHPAAARRPHLQRHRLRSDRGPRRPGTRR